MAHPLRDTWLGNPCVVDSAKDSESLRKRFWHETNVDQPSPPPDGLAMKA